MAYMCTDSGNLMAIAQQVIQQQQQQQQQRQQLQQQEHQIHQIQSTSLAPPPWPAVASSDHHHHSSPFFSDPFSAAATAAAAAAAAEPSLSTFPPPPAFRLSDLPADFDSDEWMESLIAADSSGDFAPIFTDHPSSTNTTSDLDRLVLPRGDILPVDLPPETATASSFDPPPPKPKKDPDLDSKLLSSPPRSPSSSPLLQSLLDCARVADSNPDLAITKLSQINPSTSQLGDATQRVAFYFAEALSIRLACNTSPPPCPPSSSCSDFTLCYKTLNDACPYAKFAHLTANQAILEATESDARIHIIDFGIVQGVQWAAFLQALATRPGGKPDRIRISGIASPFLGPSSAGSLAATGKRLREFAELLELKFEFIPILTPVDRLTESDFSVESGESVAVNFMLQLYQLLGDSTEPVQRVLRLAKSFDPKIVTLGEYEVSLNRIGFIDRFSNALCYYASVFESLEPAMGRDLAERVRVERFIFGERILKAVGPGEGVDRTDRMEESGEWTALMEGCGFEAVRFSNYAVSQAKLLLWDYDYSARYSLLELQPGFLSLAWDGRRLLTVSSWQ